MKLVIIVRKDLGMSCGKIAGQVGHASVMAFACPPNVDSNMKILRWYGEGQKKIVLKTETEESLNIIAKKAENENLVVHHIHDFGLTQIEPNTLTCIAIGPDEDEKIDAVIKELKLL